MYKLLLVLLICLSLMACQNDSQQSINDESAVIATIGDYKVTEAYINAFLLSQGITSPSAEQTSKALDEVVNQLSLVQQANKSGLGMTLQQQLQLKQAKHRSLAQAAIKQHLIDNPVTEADMQAEYARITAELEGEEYHVRHLLFQDESQALQVLDRIIGGGEYLTEETTYLASNPQRRNVGNIGWVNIMQVPEVFHEPLRSMPENSVYPETLVSQFGVHVLYLDGKRALDPPKFEDVKAGVKQSLEQQKVDRYQQLAVVKAKVKVAEKN